MIYTSLAEIASFKPCAGGWKDILKGQNKTQADAVLFPLTEALSSNSISDICWLLGKKQKKDVLAKFARMCADSVEHLRTVKAAAVAAGAADAAGVADAAASADAAVATDAADAAYAASADAADAAYAAADAAAYATDAADAAYAADAAVAADAAAYAAAARQEQVNLNKSFMRQCLEEAS